MMQPRYQRYTAMRLRNDAEVAAFVLRSVARQGDDRRNVFHLAAEERSSGEAIGDGFLIMQRDRTIEIGWGVHPAMWSCGFGTEIGTALLGPQLRAPRGEKRLVQDHAGKFRLGQAGKPHRHGPRKARGGLRRGRRAFRGC